MIKVFKAPCQQVCVRIIMNSLVFTSLLVFACLWLAPNSTTGRKVRVPKVKCYKAYKSESNSCKKRITDRRFTVKDCCEVNGGAAYKISKRGKKECRPCTTEENWSKWGAWSKCNSLCGPGISRRVRKCLDRNDKGCPGKKSETKDCVNLKHPNCPVHGGWTDWGNWSACSVTCEKGHQLRFRSCTNPKPQYGGRDCRGAREQKQPCEDTPHCPIDGGWGDWSSWSGCSVTCDIGYRIRTRKCNNPKPRYGGLPCNRVEGIERQSCTSHKDCGGDYSGSGASGSGVSGDGSGSGGGSGSGMVAKDGDDDGASGSGDDKSDAPPTLKTGDDFDFSEASTAVTTLAKT